MDNTSAANADKASAASSFSPTKWVAGLLGRQAPVAAATGPTEATANDAEDYVPITAAGVAAAYARKDQRAAPATTPLPISANEESACAAGTSTTTNNDDDVEQ
jgi:hypothetical protein